MLDVSIGIDIMNLLLDLRERKKLTMMYITHNLAGARYVADDIVIMYAGNAVEYGDIDEIVARPYHPYTVLLLSPARPAVPPRRSSTSTRGKTCPTCSASSGAACSATAAPCGCRAASARFPATIGWTAGW